MAAGIYNFTIEQGATFKREFKYKTSEGVGIDLTNYAVRMQVRKTIDATTKELDLTESNGLSVGTTPDTNHIITLTIPASTTQDLSFDTAVYDLEIDLSGEVTRLLQGKIKLSKEVTRG